VPELAIASWVATHERPVVESAARRLAAALSTASDDTWMVPVDAHDGLPSAPVAAPITVVSMHGVLGAPDAEQQVREAVATAQRSGSLVFLLTLFRGLPPGDPRLLPLRRLNLLAVALSHELDTAVVDLDRAFADHGAATLGADLDALSARARGIGARTLTLAILGAGLDSRLPPELAERARAALDAKDPA
jgi:hypothetical protein